MSGRAGRSSLEPGDDWAGSASVGLAAKKKSVHAVYLEQVLDPTLVPDNVVVLGNLPAHQVAGLSELVETRGARLLYLPPYSPDFNPIELAFSKLKTWLRTARTRTREAQESVIQTAMDWITGYDAKNWFDHCGYHVH